MKEFARTQVHYLSHIQLYEAPCLISQVPDHLTTFACLHLPFPPYVDTKERDPVLLYHHMVPQ